MRSRPPDRNRITIIVLWCITGVLTALWIAGITWPNWKLGALIAHPLPGRLGDIGLFIPMHIVIGYLMAVWSIDSRRWNNPALVTKNKRWSFDSRFGATRFGDQVLICANSLDTRQPGRTWGDAWALIPLTHIDLLDKDVVSETRALPIARSDYRPEICTWLTARGVPNETELYMCYADDNKDHNHPAGSPIATTNPGRDQRDFPMLHSEMGHVLTETIDTLGHIARTSKPHSSREMPDPPRYHDQMERNRERHTLQRDDEG